LGKSSRFTFRASGVTEQVAACTQTVRARAIADTKAATVA